MPDFGKKRVLLGCLAAIGVTAVVLHRYWPRGRLHGDDGHWDELDRDEGVAREGRGRVASVVRGGGRSERGRRRRRVEEYGDYEDSDYPGRGRWGGV